MSERHGSFRHFARNRKGAAIIEFALVAPFVLALLFSVLEGGWIMTQSIMLDRAFATTIRQIQLLNTTADYEQIKKQICNTALVLPNCTNAIRLEMTPITKSTDFPTSVQSCVDRRVKVDPVKSYNSGKPSQIVFARACFVVDPLMPGIGLGLRYPKDKTGGIQLMSSFAFVNEPE